eukprot:TRINITY_DN14757_c0_g1_i3.p2 TRINITY_DN14757_c0_g1~~TRINITY_DN14757_c0_g1_i3.p2  ORF type:complete len:136 (-),score=41.29 TRINITY_DN14757_c0_g1_i3:48-455(-)
MKPLFPTSKFCARRWKWIDVFVSIKLVYKICKQIDMNQTGYVQLEDIIPYIEQSQAKANTKESENELWPEWLRNEDKVHLAKEVLGKIVEAVKQRRIVPEKGFRVFDPDNTGFINEADFSKVLSKICPDVGTEEL